jgi:3-demethoxyubiquinol 3-hydroxylase
VTARRRSEETLGDRIMKVDHAGEHGAGNIYRGQLTACRYRDPALRRELELFRCHEERHRTLAMFTAEGQKYTYEVRKASIDQRRVLCEGC